MKFFGVESELKQASANNFKIMELQKVRLVTDREYQEFFEYFLESKEVALTRSSDNSFSYSLNDSKGNSINSEFIDPKVTIKVTLSDDYRTVDGSGYSHFLGQNQVSGFTDDATEFDEFKTIYSTELTVITNNKNTVLIPPKKLLFLAVESFNSYMNYSSSTVTTATIKNVLKSLMTNSSYRTDKSILFDYFDFTAIVTYLRR
jgi:hypothetical protein